MDDAEKCNKDSDGEVVTNMEEEIKDHADIVALVREHELLYYMDQIQSW